MSRARSFPPRAFVASVAAALALACHPAGAQSDVVSPLEEVRELARVIGAAHQVRQVCDSSDFTWREQMLALIELEARGDDSRQRQMIDAFNAGFRDQEQARLSCGAEATRAESELADEGRRLAEALRDRYLN